MANVFSPPLNMPAPYSKLHKGTSVLYQKTSVYQTFTDWSTQKQVCLRISGTQHDQTDLLAQQAYLSNVGNGHCWIFYFLSLCKTKTNVAKQNIKL